MELESINEIIKAGYDSAHLSSQQLGGYSRRIKVQGHPGLFNKTLSLISKYHVRAVKHGKQN